MDDILDLIIVYTKKYTKAAPNLGRAVGTLLLPALLITPAGLMSIPQVMLTRNVLLSLLGLAILCSSIACLFYYRLIRDVGPTHHFGDTSGSGLRQHVGHHLLW